MTRTPWFSAAEHQPERPGRYEASGYGLDVEMHWSSAGVWCRVSPAGPCGFGEMAHDKWRGVVRDEAGPVAL